MKEELTEGVVNTNPENRGGARNLVLCAVSTLSTQELPLGMRDPTERSLDTGHFSYQ